MPRSALKTTLLSTVALGATLNLAEAQVPGAYNWTGFYIGGHGAASLGNTDSTRLFFPNTPPANVAFSGATPNFTTSGVTGLFGPFPTLLPAQASVLGGGAQIGYNIQVGPVVYGVEADYTIFGRAFGGTSRQFPSLTQLGAPVFTQQQNTVTTGPDFGKFGFQTVTTTTISTLTTTAGTTTGQASTSTKAGLESLSTVRARLGYAFDRVLLFSTFGVAIGEGRIVSSATLSQNSSFTTATTTTTDVTTTVTPTFFGVPIPPGVTTTTSSSTSSSTSNSSAFRAVWFGRKTETLVGPVVGGGFEIGVTNNVSLKFEGLYYSLGSIKTVVNGTGTGSVNGGPAAGLSVQPYTVSRNLDGTLVKSSIVFRY